MDTNTLVTVSAIFIIAIQALILVDLRKYMYKMAIKQNIMNGVHYNELLQMIYWLLCNGVEKRQKVKKRIDVFNLARENISAWEALEEFKEDYESSSNNQ